MGKFTSLASLLVAALWLAGCATGDPRLQGTWKSHKVPMPVEMVKVTKMETVRVKKGSRKTKQVAKTVTVAQSKSAPPYIDLLIKYHSAYLTMELPPRPDGQVPRVTFPYKVLASDDKSVEIEITEPTTKVQKRIKMLFEGPNRYYVEPAGGQGWKEYYERVQQ